MDLASLAVTCWCLSYTCVCSQNKTLLIHIMYKTDSAFVRWAARRYIYTAPVLALRLPMFRTRGVTTHLLMLFVLRVLKPPFAG